MSQICIKCNNIITEGKKFCGCCGNTVETKTESKSKEPSLVTQNQSSPIKSVMAGKNKAYLITGIIAMITLIIIVIIIKPF